MARGIGYLLAIVLAAAGGWFAWGGDAPIPAAAIVGLAVLSAATIALRSRGRRARGGLIAAWVAVSLPVGAYTLLSGGPLAPRVVVLVALAAGCAAAIGLFGGRRRHPMAGYLTG